MSNPNKRFLSPASTALQIMKEHERFHRDKVVVRGKRPKIINFIKFSQNGHKESAVTEKRARECGCHRMLKFGFGNHKTL